MLYLFLFINGTVKNKDKDVDEWRTFLYPLGFLSAFAFAARFIVQWVQSEKAQQSVVPRLFWQLSLCGNLLLLLHSFIQVQYPICLMQAINAVISWRNLNLMQTQRPVATFTTVGWLLLGACLLTTLGFVVQDWILMEESQWFRVPTAPWQQASTHSLSLLWHGLGAVGYLLFCSRFWVQWWLAEKAQVSYLPLSFWWLSLSGSLLSIAYFVQTKDSVNLLGPSIGLIQYMRNLMLIYKAKTTSATQQP
jgi:lipid-A-disaccharide synthase